MQGTWVHTQQADKTTDYRWSWGCGLPVFSLMSSWALQKTHRQESARCSHQTCNSSWLCPQSRRYERMPVNGPRLLCRGWPSQDGHFPRPWPGWCWGGLWSASVKASCCCACSTSSSWWSCTSTSTRSTSTSSAASTTDATDPGTTSAEQRWADIITTITTFPGQTRRWPATWQQASSWRPARSRRPIRRPHPSRCRHAPRTRPASVSRHLRVLLHFLQHLHTSKKHKIVIFN